MRDMLGGAPAPVKKSRMQLVDEIRERGLVARSEPRER
jgi:hypothetical protein